MHKYVLHGLGKKKRSAWSSHWHQHHKVCRKNNNCDTEYLKGFLSGSNRKEVFGLGGLSIIHAPLAFVDATFYLVLIACSIRYYLIHKRAHLDVEWCKEKLPWHYDHHMGKNQDANWGVTTDWVDRLMGTRIKY